MYLNIKYLKFSCFYIITFSYFLLLISVLFFVSFAVKMYFCKAALHQYQIVKAE